MKKLLFVAATIINMAAHGDAVERLVRIILRLPELYAGQFGRSDGKPLLSRTCPPTPALYLFGSGLLGLVGVASALRSRCPPM